MGEDALKRFLAILLFTGCATTHSGSTALTVGEVWARHHDLDGTIIRVQGVVPKCYKLGCELYASASNRAKWVSIGTSEAFDDAVIPYLGKNIVVEGRLRADCLHAFADKDGGERDGNIIICSDRASMLMEPKLIGVAR